MKKMLLKLAVLMGSVSSSVWAVPTDYLVLRWTEQQGLVSDFHQVVDLPAGQFLLDKKPDKSVVTLIGKNGEEKWVSIEKSQFTHAEFHGQGSIEGQQLMNDEVVFVVRAEQGWVDQLTLPPGLAQKSNQIYLWDALLANANNKTPQVQIQKSATKAGAQDNRVNLLFLGDGYTAGQQAGYNQNVDDVIDYMNTFEPYESYSQFFSYDRLFVASNESGADKPAPCFSPEEFKDTAFDGKFCTSGIDRLVTVSSSKIFIAAAASPNWDEIVVIVNDTRYGGSGGVFSTISTNESAPDVFIHEFGHSFTALADEYDSPYPGYPACSDINGPACEANVTDVTIRNNIKWSYFISPTTPIPTPETSQYNGVVGLFEGARYQETGWYRPKNACNMKVLGVDFCEVCQEAYVFKVFTVPYAGGGLISLYEPGSAIPVNSMPTAMVSVPMNFSVEIVQPSHGVTVTWLVDNNQQSSGNSTDVLQTFGFVPNQTGQTSVKVIVKDNSPFVHSSRRNELPDFEVEWLLNVQPFVDLIFENGFD